MILKIQNVIKKGKEKRIEKLRTEFLPQAEEIVEKPLTPLSKIMIWSITGLILFFVLWSVFGKMDKVLTARGKITLIGGNQIVQSMNGGLIEKICVKEGQEVKAGDVILCLDTTVEDLTNQNTKESLELLKYENLLLEKAAKGEKVTSDMENIEDENKSEVAKYVCAMQAEYEAQMKETENLMKQCDIQLKEQQDILNSISLQQEYVKSKYNEEKQEDYSEQLRQKELENLRLTIDYMVEAVNEKEYLYNIGAIPRKEVETAKQELELKNNEYELKMIAAKQEEEKEEEQEQTVDLEKKYGIESANNEYEQQKKVVTLYEEKLKQQEIVAANLETQYQKKS